MDADIPSHIGFIKLVARMLCGVIKPCICYLYLVGPTVLCTALIDEDHPKTVFDCVATLLTGFYPGF